MGSVGRTAAAVAALGLVMASCGTCPRKAVTRTILLEFGAPPASPAGQSPAPPPFVLDYERLDLGGGLAAVVTRQPDAIPVTLSLWIRAGSDDEEANEAGASHLWRIALADPALDPGASGAISAIEAAGGLFEARTSRRYTVVTVRAPAKRLDDALRALHPFLAPPAEIPAPALDAARAAVAKEADAWWASRSGRALDGVRSLLLGRAASSGLYPDLGALAQTGAAGLGSFVTRTYVSGGMVLGAGLPYGKASALSSLPGPRAGKGDPPDPAKASSAVLVAVAAPPAPTPGGAASPPLSQEPIVAIGWSLPPITGEDGAAARIAAEWLSSGGPGTLLDHASSCPDMSGGADVEVDLAPEGTLVTMAAGARPGGEAGLAACVASSLAVAMAVPPGMASLEDASRSVITSWMTGLADPFAAPALLAGHLMLAPDGPSPEEHLASLYGTGPEDSGALVGRLGPGIAPAVVVAPAPAADSKAIQAAIEAALGAVRDLDALAADECGAPGPYATSSVLPGARVAALETAGKGRATVAAYLAAGTLSEPDGREGAARLLSLLVARTLDEALREVPGLDPDLVESSVTSEADRTGVIVTVPASRWREALDAARHALLAPDLDPASFEAERQRCLALAADREDPASQSLWTAVSALLGASGDPGPAGTVSSLGTLSAAWIGEFHEAAARRGIAIAVAGDLDAALACRSAVLSLHPWASSKGAAAPVTLLVDPSPAAPPPAGLAPIATGPGTLSSVTLAWAAPGAADPERLAMGLLAEILDSRLRAEIVEKGGLATSAGATAWATSGWGVLAVRAVAPSPNLAALTEALRAAVDGLAKDPPSADEVDGAIDRMVEARAVALALPCTAAPLLGGSLLAGETLLVPGDLESALAAVDGKRVSSLATAWLSAAPIVASVSP